MRSLNFFLYFFNHIFLSISILINYLACSIGMADYKPEYDPEILQAQKQVEFNKSLEQFLQTFTGFVSNVHITSQVGTRSRGVALYTTTSMNFRPDNVSLPLREVQIQGTVPFEESDRIRVYTIIGQRAYEKGKPVYLPRQVTEKETAFKIEKLRKVDDLVLLTFTDLDSLRDYNKLIQD